MNFLPVAQQRPVDYSFIERAGQQAGQAVTSYPQMKQQIDRQQLQQQQQQKMFDINMERDRLGLEKEKAAIQELQNNPKVLNDLYDGLLQNIDQIEIKEKDTVEGPMDPKKASFYDYLRRKINFEKKKIANKKIMSNTEAREGFNKFGIFGEMLQESDQVYQMGQPGSTQEILEYKAGVTPTFQAQAAAVQGKEQIAAAEAKAKIAGEEKAYKRGITERELAMKEAKLGLDKAELDIKQFQSALKARNLSKPDQEDFSKLVNSWAKVKSANRDVQKLIDPYIKENAKITAKIAELEGKSDEEVVIVEDQSIPVSEYRTRLLSKYDANKKQIEQQGEGINLDLQETIENRIFKKLGRPTTTMAPGKEFAAEEVVAQINPETVDVIVMNMRNSLKGKGFDEKTMARANKLIQQIMALKSPNKKKALAAYKALEGRHKETLKGLMRGTVKQPEAKENPIEGSIENIKKIGTLKKALEKIPRAVKLLNKIGKDEKTNARILKKLSKMPEAMKVLEQYGITKEKIDSL